MHAALARPRPRRPSRRAPSWPVRAPVSQTDRPAPGFSRERAETARRARAPRRRTPATSARQQPELSERRIAYPGWVSGNPPSPLLFHPVSRLALPRRGAGLFPQWHFAKEPCGFSSVRTSPLPNGAHSASGGRRAATPGRGQCRGPAGKVKRGGCMWAAGCWSGVCRVRHSSASVSCCVCCGPSGGD